MENRNVAQEHDIPCSEIDVASAPRITPPAEYLAYWTERLAGAPLLQELPTDAPRPAVRSGQLGRIDIAISSERDAALRSFIASHDLDPASTFVAVLNILLARYNGDPDVVTALSHVHDAGGPDCPLILRNPLQDSTSFLGVVRQIECIVRDAQRHPAVPAAQIAEAMGYALSASHAPLAQTLFIPDHDAVDISHDASEPLRAFDLIFRIRQAPAIKLEILYSTDIFKSRTIERMADHFISLFDNLLADAHSSALRAPLLSNGERQRILRDWNTTGKDYPRACAHELFEDHVELIPDARAVVLGDFVLSYRQLNEKANQLAHHLKDQGVGPDVLVGVSVKRSPEMVIALLGILKAGGAYLPLDPAYPADRLAYMIDDARPALILTQESLLTQLPAQAHNLFCLDRDWHLLSPDNTTNPRRIAGPRTLAYVIYTSGSTGKPKGVTLEHGGLTNLCMAQAEAFEVDTGSQVLQFASISFDAAVSETFVTLAKGACLHLIRQEALRSAYEITSVIEKSAISVVTLPPSLLAVLPRKPLPALKTLVLAGESWSPELARFWAVGRRLLNAYGPTEGTVCATWHPVEPDATGIVPIGKPLANVEVYILDRHLEPVPVGVPGELYIGGAGIARGYLHRPELTKERFIPDPFSGRRGARLYRSGDKARYLEDGNIEFLGRIDNQVKLRGYRIELGEIETAVMTHSSVQNACVIVREDHPGERRLVAYVVSKGEITGSSLKLHLKSTLPDYMIPQNFVFIGAIPMGPNGKVNRALLPEPEPARA